MCGIAGVHCSTGETETLLSAMLRLIAHRGPDDSGTYLYSADGNGSCGGLGHRRLSLVDLSQNARQPFVSRDGKRAVVVNGEIYNWKELQRELPGHVWQSRCDSETALHALEEWGTDALGRFNGMFALAYWDDDTKRLILARDQFGIKPLYWARQGDTTLYASEIKSLLPTVGLEPDSRYLSTFLSLGLLDTGASTPVAGVKSLLPGTYLEVTPDGTTVRRFYNIDEPPTVSPDELLELFQEAVEMRLATDATLAYCISGGFDSTALLHAALNAGQTAGRRAYTVYYEEPGMDERAYAKAAVKETGVRHTELKPEPEEFLEEAERFFNHIEGPTATLGPYSQWRLVKRAKEDGVRVLMDGQGADELFAGYSSYMGTALRERLLEHDLAGAARALAGGGLYSAKIAALGAFPALERPQFGPAPGEALRSRRRYRSIRNLKERLRADVVQFHLPLLFRYLDRNSMAFGLESRVPYLDPRIVALALSPDSPGHVKGGETKAWLRRALAPLVPRPVLEREDKVVFATPLGSWLRGPLREWATDLLSSQLLIPRLTHRVNPAKAFRLEPMHLWRLVSVEAWWRAVSGANAPTSGST